MPKLADQQGALTPRRNLFCREDNSLFVQFEERGAGRLLGTGINVTNHRFEIVMLLWSTRHDRRASRLLFGTLLAAVVSSASTAAIMRPMDGFTSSMRAFGQWYTCLLYTSPSPRD